MSFFLQFEGNGLSNLQSAVLSLPLGQSSHEITIFHNVHHDRKDIFESSHTTQQTNLNIFPLVTQQYTKDRFKVSVGDLHVIILTPVFVFEVNIEVINKLLKVEFVLSTIVLLRL